jgi:hypothetical protein
MTSTVIGAFRERIFNWRLASKDRIGRAEIIFDAEAFNEDSLSGVRTPDT